MQHLKISVLVIWRGQYGRLFTISSCRSSKAEAVLFKFSSWVLVHSLVKAAMWADLSPDWLLDFANVWKKFARHCGVSVVWMHYKTLPLSTTIVTKYHQSSIIIIKSKNSWEDFVSRPYSSLFCQHSGKRCLGDHRCHQEPTSTCVHSNQAAYRQSFQSNDRCHSNSSIQLFNAV